jgi:hypothetical protein
MGQRELDEYLHPVQVEIFRKMSLEARWDLTNQLIQSTWNRALEGFRRVYPELSEAQVLKKFVASLYGQELADKVYPDL